MDEIWLYAYNSSGAGVLLTIEWGGVVVPDDQTKVTINPQSGRILVVDGKLLQNGLLVRAFADTASVVCIDGFVNRIV